MTFDNIYHEHTNYWSITSLNKFLNDLDLKIFDVEEINTHGGSIRVYVTQKNDIEINESVYEYLNYEEDFGLKKISTYLNFGKKIENLKQSVSRNLKKLNEKYSLIVGYGAPAKATTALNYFNIKNEIKYIIEDNPLKKGKFVPGVNIPIIQKRDIEDKNSLLLVLAWNFFDEIKNNNNNLTKDIISIKDLEKN